MATTIFSNGRNTFDTVIEGTDVVLRGQCTVGDSANTFYGQISKKESCEYVGDYSETNISISDMTKSALMVEAATLWSQLGTDITGKAKEVRG